MAKQTAPRARKPAARGPDGSAPSPDPGALAAPEGAAAPPASAPPDVAATQGARPVVRLRPKGGGRFFAGAPWVYGNEIVLDRRAKAIAPGAIVRLEDAERRPLGAAAFNPGSGVAARWLDPDPDARIDADWLARKLSRAAELRARLYDAPVYRLAHAEADGLPGLVIDRFGDVVSVQPNAAWIDARAEALLAALERAVAPKTVIWSAASRARALEGLGEETRLLKGEDPGAIELALNGALYFAEPLGGQKTGLYLDQRDNHAFVAGLARGAEVLDVFSHVGGFGLAALAAGARAALAVDGSAAALAHAARAAERMGAGGRYETRRGDAFDVMRALLKEGRRFEAVICDPPAFAPNRASVENGLRGYAKTARLGLSLTASGGIFTICSCSHAVDATLLQQTVAGAIRRVGRPARLLRVGGAGADHPVHPMLPETGYLKALTYALD